MTSKKRTSAASPANENKLRSQLTPYQKRVRREKERSKLLGIPFSLSRARGHSKSNEPSISQLKAENKKLKRATSTRKNFDKVFRKMFNENMTLNKAAHALNINPEAVAKYGLENDLFGKSTSSKRVVPIIRKIRIVATTGIFEDAPVSLEVAKTVGSHLNYVRNAPYSDESKRKLKKFAPRIVLDLHGNKYKLETDFEALVLMGYFDDYPSKDATQQEIDEYATSEDDKVYKKEAA